MATPSFFLLLDDIAALLDDIALLSKTAAQKTAGVLGDDLALNAQQVTGVTADRELPVVWAVFLGSLKNKVILIPLALAISAFLPWAVTPLLMLGGAYLCYEGFEKVLHSLHPTPQADQADSQHHEQLVEAVQNAQLDLVAWEKDKIKGAVRTDFILSAEIIVIALGIVAQAPLTTQVAVLCAVGMAMTVGVYGLVAGIVKLDDAGLYLNRLPPRSALSRLLNAIGYGLLQAAPKLMKLLSVLGTVAMFLVGGGILAHGIAPLHHALESFSHGLQPALLGTLVSNFANGLLGVLAGAVVLGGVSLISKILPRK